MNRALPDASTTGGAEGPCLGLEDLLAEAMLTAAIQTLRRRPDLMNAMKELIGAGARRLPTPTRLFMTLAEYARYRAVSERTIRYDIEDMERGKHYDYAGRKGGRLIIRVEAADGWYAERSRARGAVPKAADLVVDEVTRRRARVALKKNKVK